MTALKKALIVEDNRDILELLVTIMSELGGYRIICASDGHEALRNAYREDPDIIILDAHLPKVDGYEVCKLIKSNPCTSDIKVLMISGMTQTYYQQKAQQAGADAYFVKPFSSVELVEKLDELLGIVR